MWSNSLRCAFYDLVVNLTPRREGVLWWAQCWSCLAHWLPFFKKCLCSRKIQAQCRLSRGSESSGLLGSREVCSWGRWHAERWRQWQRRNRRKMFWDTQQVQRKWDRHYLRAEKLSTHKAVGILKLCSAGLVDRLRLRTAAAALFW